MVLGGIDPGKTNGFALWDPSRTKWDPLKLQLESFSFWDLYDFIPKEFTTEQIGLYIEDPRKNGPTFGRNRMKKAVLDRKAQNVGMNKQSAALLISGFQRLGYVVLGIRPGSAKWTCKQLKQYSGYSGKSNQHERDAARLVVGRSAINSTQFKKMLKEAS